MTCRATKRDGTPCTLPANSPEGLCWAHDPANQEKRRRGQRLGGRSKPNQQLADIKRRLLSLVDDVLAGDVDRSDAAVAGQLLNTVIRAISVELHVREQLELIERLEALEEALEQNKGGSRWGA